MDETEATVRGKTKTRKKHLQQAGWLIVEERQEHHGAHSLVLHHLHGHRNVHDPSDPRAREVRIEAATRPQAYFKAERTLIRKEGRHRHPVLD